jgi:type II secretory pathway predicted ATPase ExeA
MSDILQSAFSLRHSPFAPDVAAEDLWLDDARKDAIDRVVDAVSRRRHVLVKGEAGTGKNCLLRAMRSRLSSVHYRTVYVANVTLGRRDFYRQVCSALGIVPKGTPAGLFEAIQRDVEAQHREHRVHPVLVLDEAHLMPDSTLGHLHVLANFDWDSQPLLSLVLVGLPELHDRLRLGIHRALLTRLSVCVEVAPAAPEQTAAYVRRRLESAGSKAELFAPDALVLLHELTGGSLRSVDVLADAALRVAAQQEIRLVDRAVVRRALQHTPLA